MVSNSTIFLCLWLFFTAICAVDAVQVRFYKDYNYTDILFESTSTEKCTNLPESVEIAGVKSYTTDTCLIIYWNFNCHSTHTFKESPSNHSAGNGFYYPFKSFHVCNDDEGGAELNVDITKYYDKENPTDFPVVLERYRHVCSCINIPDYVKKLDKWSINNHHNEFLAYFESDCKENKLSSAYFRPGYSERALNIYNYTKTLNSTEIFNIQSFRPDPNSTYFKSGCRNSILLSQLTSTIEVLVQRLKVSDSKVTASQRNISEMQNARTIQAVELTEKFRLVDSKTNNVKSNLDSQVENLKFELQVLSNRQDASQKNIANLNSTQTRQTKEILEISNKTERFKNNLDDKIVKMNGNITLMARRQNLSEKDIHEMNKTYTSEMAVIGENIRSLNVMVDNVEKTMDDEAKSLKDELQGLTVNQNLIQNDIAFLNSTHISEMAEISGKILGGAEKINDLEKLLQGEIESLKDEVQVISNRQDSSQTEIINLNTTHSQKIQEIVGKIDDVEKAMVDKMEKLREDLEYNL